MNPFLQARLSQVSIDQPSFQEGGWFPASEQAAYPAEPLTVFRPSACLDQEGFESSTLSFQPPLSPQVTVSSPAELLNSRDSESAGSQNPTSQEMQTSVSYGEEHKTTPYAKKVMVLDKPGHGDKVASIIANRIGEENVIRKEDLPELIPFDECANLDQLVEKALTSALEDKTRDIQDIVACHADEVGTVNISSGFSKAEMADSLFEMMKSDPRKNRLIRQGLGLSLQAPSQDVLVALTTCIETVSRNNPDLERVHAEYQRAVDSAKEKNIAIVVAAGNDYDTSYKKLDAAFKAKYGENYSLKDDKRMPDIMTNVYSKADGVITVGAVDDKGTAQRDDDLEAVFSSRTDKVTIAANGVRVASEPHDSETGASRDSCPDSGFDGTSFAAPLVAAGLATIQDEYGLDVNQRTQALIDSAARKDQLDRRVVGNGIYDLEGALAKAKEIKDNESL